MSTFILAGKDLRLLLRDARSCVILLVMPLLFVAVLGMTVGEGFGQKPDDRLRISIVNLDEGLPNGLSNFPGKRWSEVVIDDLASTADIRIEIIPDRREAESLIRQGKRSAVLIFEPRFSEEMNRCSFLTKAEPPPLNPLYANGIDVEKLGLSVLRDPTQEAAASIIEQVAQVTLLRVVIPWMIGKAFEKVGDKEFMNLMAEQIPLMKAAFNFVSKEKIGDGVKLGIATLFSNYNFTAKTWAGLTKNEMQPTSTKNRTVYSAEPSGLLKRGTLRYQILVPSYTVMFAFFMVVTVGWMFVAERRQGTLVRLRAAPLSKGQILFGKFLPCLLLSLFQGVFMLVAGNLIFGMKWGPQPLWLLAVAATTSLAAMGMAMLIAGLARTEAQVAVYGSLLVLVLAGLSGTLMPRDLMPEDVRQFSYITPHAWALDAYSQLLLNPQPELGIVIQSCGVLIAFGIGFLGLAWWSIKLD
ncbi:MAG: ABC transporter permease [Planctomycetes bacterium]|nr:ABC transporter permease [Planctomycetota bacterium]